MSKFIIGEQVKFLGCGVNDDFIMDKVREFDTPHE